MLDQITPVILTFNEAANIERTLERLVWARDIVVVDSFSDDDTIAIAARLPQVRWFQRKFDCPANQWNYALTQTGVASEWVLALDADYVLTPELVEEFRTLAAAADVGGYRARFVYCIDGRPLRGSAYPPVTVLYRLKRASYRQDGHTHRVVVEGGLEWLQSSILHDDRKSFDHWLRSQTRYMKLETEKLTGSSWAELGWPDRVRKLKIVAPLAILFYCLFVKGTILDGRAGLYYAFQRTLSESILSLNLIGHSFRRRKRKPVEAIEAERSAAELVTARSRK